MLSSAHETTGGTVALRSVRQFAEEIGVKPRTAYYIVAREEIEVILVAGGEYRISDKAIAEYKRRNTRPARPA